MKRCIALLAVLVLAGCEWHSYEIREVHRLVGWTQPDLGGGVYGPVSADWYITNRGDMWFWAQLTVRVEAASGDHAATTGLFKVQPGTTAAGTLIVDTATEQATAVTLVKNRPDVTETW